MTTSFGIELQQSVWAKPHLLEHAGPEALDEQVGGRNERPDDLGRLRIPQVEAEALLVAGVDLPVRADALGLPGPQRVALGRLDLDHVGAEVAEHLREDVAGKEAREVEDAHPVQGAATLGS